MKKISVLLSISICFMVLVFVSTAEASSKITSTKSVSLSSKETTFAIHIDINNPSDFSGAEFGIQCADTVKVKSVTYSTRKSTAGPTEARGLTWFGFFSGANDFKGTVTATLNLEYTGTANTSVVIDNVVVYTQTDNDIEKEYINPRTVIEIKKEGATNPIDPPDPPESSDGGNGSPSSTTGGGSGNGNGNSGSGSGASRENQTANANNNGGATTGGSSSSSSGSKSSSSGSGKNSSSDASSNSDDADRDTYRNEASGAEDTYDEDAQQVLGNSNNQGKDYAALNLGLLIALIVSVAVNLVLGYLLYSTNKKKNLNPNFEEEKHVEN